MLERDELTLDAALTSSAIAVGLGRLEEAKFRDWCDRHRRVLLSALAGDHRTDVGLGRGAPGMLSVHNSANPFVVGASERVVGEVADRLSEPASRAFALLTGSLPTEVFHLPRIPVDTADLTSDIVGVSLEGCTCRLSLEQGCLSAASDREPVHEWVALGHSRDFRFSPRSLPVRGAIQRRPPPPPKMFRDALTSRLLRSEWELAAAQIDVGRLRGPGLDRLMSQSWTQHPAVRQAIALRRGSMRLWATRQLVPETADLLTGLYRHARHIVGAGRSCLEARAHFVTSSLSSLDVFGAVETEALESFLGRLSTIRGRSLSGRHRSNARVELLEGEQRVYAPSSLGVGDYSVVVHAAGGTLQLQFPSGFWAAYAQVALEGITSLSIRRA